VQKNLAFPSHVFRSLFVEQETGRLGKFTANFLLNTVLDFFHSFAHCWKKICLGQESFL